MEQALPGFVERGSGINSRLWRWQRNTKLDLNHRRPTRRDEFLDTMNRIVPWSELCAVIEPNYPKQGNGSPPIGLERKLRIHFIQHWFNLADFACEEALYDIPNSGTSVYLVRIVKAVWRTAP